MSRLPFAAAGVLGAVMLAAVTPGRAATLAPQPAQKTFVYIVNYNHNTLVGYAETADGSLRRCARIRTPAGPEAVAIAGTRFVLTVDSGANALSSYRIDAATGALQAVGNWHETPGSSPFSVSVTPGGHFAYVANSGNATVGAYRIRAGGQLLRAAVQREPQGASPYHVAFAPDGQFAYVANYGNDTIGIFRRTPGRAALTRIGVYHEPTGDGPYDLAVGPDGHYLYVADFRSNILLVLQIHKNGLLSQRDRVAEPFDHHRDSLVIDPSGRYLFVANTSANDITAFHIQQTTGRLTRAGRVPTGGYPFSLTLDKAARFVYAVNFGSSTISGYRLDHRTGLLAPLGITHEPGAAGPYGIAAVTLPGRTGAARPVSKKTR